MYIETSPDAAPRTYMHLHIFLHTSLYIDVVCHILCIHVFMVYVSACPYGFMYMYASMYTCVYVSMVYVSVCPYGYMDICTCVYGLRKCNLVIVYLHILDDYVADIQVGVSPVFMSAHIYIYTHIYICIYVHKRYVYMYIWYMYMNTCIYTHI